MRLALVLVMFVGFVLPAEAAKRVALVIGNSAYVNATALTNPKNDAEDVAKKLTGLGFDVTHGEDLSLAGMRDLVRKFQTRLDGADVALLYYAGHGLQVNGTNYLVPIDATLATEEDVGFETVAIDKILGPMERASATNLVFLDACRNNPLAKNLARSMGTRSAAVGNGLAQAGGGVGTLIAFATQPGNVALDGNGRNSPFTEAFLKHAGTPGQDIMRDLIMVRQDVIKATDGAQVTWDNNSLTGTVTLYEQSSDLSANAAAALPDPAADDAKKNAEAVFKAAGDDVDLLRVVAEQYKGTVWGSMAEAKLSKVMKPKVEEPHSQVALGETPVMPEANGLDALANSEELSIEIGSSDQQFGESLLVPSPDGSRAVRLKAAGFDVHSLTDGKVLANRPEGPFVVPRTVTLSLDNKSVLQVLFDGTMLLRNAATGEIRKTFPKPSAVPVVARFGPDDQQALVAFEDGSAKLLDINTGDTRKTFNSSNLLTFWKDKGLRDATLSRSGKLLAAASQNGSAQIWDVATGELKFTLSGHGGWVESVAFSDDETRLVTASADHFARIWDTGTGTLLTTLEGHSDRVKTAQLSHDGRFVVTVGGILDDTARVWEVASGQLLNTFGSPEKPVHSAFFDPKGRLVIGQQTLMRLIPEEKFSHRQ